jgi:hypothetical protein
MNHLQPPPRLPFRVVLCATAALLCTAVQAQVAPPPLPAGSDLVKVEPGLDDKERKRHIRAHHHKGHHKRDYTRDDSLPEQAGPKNEDRKPNQGAR